MAQQAGSRLVPGTKLTVDQALDLIPPAVKEHIASLPDDEAEQALAQLVQPAQLEYRTLAAADIRRIKVRTGSRGSDRRRAPPADLPPRRSARARRSSMGSGRRTPTSLGRRSAATCESTESCVGLMHVVCALVTPPCSRRYMAIGAYASTNGGEESLAGFVIAEVISISATPVSADCQPAVCLTQSYACQLAAKALTRWPRTRSCQPLHCAALR
jgi:hypothetical protein